MKFDDIYDYPVNSIGWRKLKPIIESKIRDRKEYDRYVLCLDSLITKENPLISELFTKKYINKEEIKLFDTEKTFMMDKDIHLIERYKADYDQRYIQLIVGCVIYDEYNNFIILEPNTRAKRCTLVKGHVDFNKNCYHLNELDFLFENMKREMEEELIIPKELKINPKLEGMIYYGTKPKCMERMGIIYSQKIPFKLIKKIKTGEPEKHRVILTNKSSLLSGKYFLDDWLNYIFRNQR